MCYCAIVGTSDVHCAKDIVNVLKSKKKNKIRIYERTENGVRDVDPLLPNDLRAIKLTKKVIKLFVVKMGKKSCP